MSERYPTGMGGPYTPEPPFLRHGTLRQLALWVWGELERIAARIRATQVHTHQSPDLTVLTGNSFIGRGLDAGQGPAADLAVSDTATVAWTFTSSGVSAVVPAGSIGMTQLATTGQYTVLGRVAAGTGAPTYLTPTQLNTTVAQANLDMGSNTVNAGAFKVATVQVVGVQGAAVADASGGAVIDVEARAALNALLARVRTHGLIGT